MRPRRTLAAIAAVTLAAAAPAAAQMNLSGQADVVLKSGTDRDGVNTGLRGNTPFADVRVRLLASRWFDDNLGFFAELLFDTEAAPQIFGAYMVANELAGRPWLNARVGLAPSPLGSFPQRGTYFNANPVIGSPMVWQYRTTLDRSGAADAAQLLARRRANNKGLPAMYESCWNLQAELLGEFGILEYSVGVTPAAVSNPGSRRDDGAQLLGRIGAEPLPGLRLGLSGAYGPYIERQGATRFDSTAFDPTDFDQRIAGYDAELSIGRVRLFSEGFVSTWQAPLVAEDLTVTGVYGEARYTFLPGWSAAARIDRLAFSDITAPGSAATGWDDDVLRYEAALNWRLAREVIVRLDWQRTTFTTGTDPDLTLLALQVSAAF